MESTVSFKVVLEGKIDEMGRSKGDRRAELLNEIETLLRQFFEINQKLIKRGVFNRDPALDNYGVRQRDGKVLLIDIGELSNIWDDGFEQGLSSVEGGMPYTYNRLYSQVPSLIKETFDLFARCRVSH